MLIFDLYLQYNNPICAPFIVKFIPELDITIILKKINSKNKR